MIRAVRILAQTAPSTTNPGTATLPTLLPGASSTTTTAAPTTTTAPASTTTSTTVAAHSTAATTTTVAHSSAAATATTTAGGSSAISNDRGVVHQLFLDAGSTKAGAHTAQIYLAAPFKVLLILVIALVLTRLVSRLSHRIVNGMRLVSPLVQATPRGAARVQTLAGAFTSVFRAVIWVIAFLEVLNEFSINLAPFLAGATVVGAALGFGAQSLVKDFLSGMLILAEDQYGVGDHIAIGTGGTQTSGTVESVNLRVTRLRGADGGILYVPNGEIRTLSNDTETDSQALVDLVLPFGTDLVAAGVAAQEAAREMAEDPEWASEFSGSPYFAGVQDATSANGVVVRIMALTRPGQHLRLAREMRLRVMERLRRDHLAWAPPDAEPASIPAEEVRKARAEKRQAEKASAERIRGVGRPAKRASKRAAAKAAKAAENAPPAVAPPRPAPPAKRAAPADPSEPSRTAQPPVSSSPAPADPSAPSEATQPADSSGPSQPAPPGRPGAPAEPDPPEG